MARSKAKISDGVAVEVNGDPDKPYAPEELDQSFLDDCKGPDDDQWAEPDARDEPDYDAGDPEVIRHDDPTYKSDGSIDTSTVVTGVKGPGPEWPPVPE